MGRRQKAKLGYSFVPFPRFVLEHEAFGRLSGNAVKLLCSFLTSYRGTNNGDLSAAWKIMHPLGWTSKHTLAQALKELVDADFIIQTRQGGRHQCSLFAIAFYDIDDCPGKGLEVGPRVKSSAWMDAHPERQRRKPPVRPKASVPPRNKKIPAPVVGAPFVETAPVVGAQVH
jgi:hypothetical protein